ncbi:hypothetical protein G6F57_016938 [Rhizopus arrhizus]|nr:hypothetical protein G6F57_016938 [Rhizopus arrhizus]
MLVGLEDVPQILARGAHARQVGRGIATQVAQRAHGVCRAGARGTARAEGHADVLGLDRQHLLGRADQPFLTGQIARGKEFQTEGGRSRNRTAHGPPEPVDLEALQHGADEPEQQGVDDDEKEPEGDDRDGQRQQHKHRFDQHVHQAQHQRGDQRRSEAGHGDAGQQVGNGQQGHCIQDPDDRPDPGAASSASHPASSGAGGRPSRPGAWAARRLRRTCTLRCA